MMTGALMQKSVRISDIFFDILHLFSTLTHTNTPVWFEETTEKSRRENKSRRGV